jgi:hypothetical protein
MKHKQDALKCEAQRARQRFLRLLLMPLFMVAGWIGCKHPANIAADPNLVGAYALVSVDGKKVPCTLQHDGHTLTIKSGTFSINPDGTCNSRVAFSMPSGGDSSREVQATYTQQGSRLTMKWQRAGITTGTVAGNTFTMNNEGMVFAYRK